MPTKNSTLSVSADLFATEGLPRLTDRDRLIIATILEGAEGLRAQLSRARTPSQPRSADLRVDPAPPGSVERFRREPYRLTRREAEVLEGIANGLTNKEIGLKLGISDRTVETHRKRVMEKLGAHRVSELMLAVWGPAAAAGRHLEQL
jgi:DNA-binding NarL/FixJ family response regulator